MRVSTDTTVAGIKGKDFDLTIPVEYQEFENLAEAIEQTGDEANLLAIVNKRGQKQGATQGGKQGVRDALVACDEAGFTPDDCQAAVESGDDGDDEAMNKLIAAVHTFQKSCAGYIMGKARSGAGGLTKTAARRAGVAIAEELGEDEFRQLCIAQFGPERAEEILKGSS